MIHKFYSHIIEIDSLYIELDLLDMTTDEREELKKILDSSIHHVVIDTILSELSGEHKKVFLSHVTLEKHTEIWELLNTHVPAAGKKITRAVERLKKQMHNDIKKAKK